MRVRAACMWLACCVAACSGEARRPTCVDADGDSFGRNCAAGPDCDDRDPERSSSCADAGSVDCAEDPLHTGCPCLAGDRHACYAAAPETMDVAGCQAGRSLCLEGEWSECDGAVLPTFETCNTQDDDCDGAIDEGVQSPCGACNDACTGGVWGPPSAPFAADAALDVTAAGELTLHWEQREAKTLWVPNTDEGTVSKIDVVSARELARFRIGAAPTRVAVDLRGDAWVLSGAPAGQAQLTKIAGLREHCVDRDGDGLETAQTAGEPLPLGGDECVLLRLPLGAAGDDARALSIDGAVAPDAERVGNVWVGFAGSERVLAFDAQGKELLAVDVPGFHAYASAFDAWGVLWLIDRAGRLASVDPAQLPAVVNVREVPYACFTLQGFSIEPKGTLLFAGLGCETVLSYDPRRDAWRRVQARSLLSPAAVVALPDASWVLYASGRVGKVTHDPFALGMDYALTLGMDAFQPYEAAALAADSFGQIWAVSTQGGPQGQGVATRFDPQRMAVTAQVPVGMGPRGSGDLSGYALAGEFVRQGSASHVFRGCELDPNDDAQRTSHAQTRWGALHMAYVLGAAASVDVEVRRAASETELADASFRALGSVPGLMLPLPLALPEGGVVEVRLTLRSPAAIGAPRIARVGLEWRCPGPE